MSVHADCDPSVVQTSWRPAPADQFPFQRSFSPAPTPSVSVPQPATTSDAAPKPTGAYRPPHARGTLTPSIFKREDEGGAPYVRPNGTPTDGASSLAALAASPKRRTIPGAAAPAKAEAKDAQPRRKKKAPEANGSPAPVAVAEPAPVVVEEPSLASLSPEDKKKRALLKKLGAIDQLKGASTSAERLQAKPPRRQAGLGRQAGKDAAEQD
jgi:translation initiation factor 2A